MGQIPYIPVINQSDLTEEISRDDVVHLLGQDRQVFQSSAKTGENVEEVFLALAQAL